MTNALFDRENQSFYQLTIYGDELVGVLFVSNFCHNKNNSNICLVFKTAGQLSHCKTESKKSIYHYTETWSIHVSNLVLDNLFSQNTSKAVYYEHIFGGWLLILFLYRYEHFHNGFTLLVLCSMLSCFNSETTYD